MLSQQLRYLLGRPALIGFDFDDRDRGAADELGEFLLGVAELFAAALQPGAEGQHIAHDNALDSRPHRFAWSLLSTLDKQLDKLNKTSSYQHSKGSQIQ
jgi:hypothetical protein